MVGWGSVPFYSEYTSDGTLVHDVQFAMEKSSFHSYRVFKAPWMGRPLTRPDIAVSPDSKVGYTSWNGATEVESWAILEGESFETLVEVERVRKTGFETTFSLSGKQRYTAVAAYDAKVGSIILQIRA